jgi:hypothetical protein
MRCATCALFCLLSLACTTSNTRADADEPRPDTTVSVDWSDTDPAPPEPDPHEIRTSPSVALDLPECPAERGGALIHYCTEDDKLVGSWVPVDTLKIPDDVEIRFNAEGPDQRTQTSLMIATRGEALYIRHVTCGGCRRVIGQGFFGYPSRMDASQLRAMQAQLGLGDDAPLLDSAEAWTRYCEDPAGKATLTKIAGKAEGDAGGRGR